VDTALLKDPMAVEAFMHAITPQLKIKLVESNERRP